MVPAFGFIV
jgi:hypothetical protein